ncbi:MAG: hypothetical protein ACRDGQ_12440 [Candidatus Limnocylindrales bacterium]
MTTRAEAPADDDGADHTTVWFGLLIFLAMLGIYIVSNPDRVNFYNHFVWQASAWLEGQAGIRFPVTGTPTSPGNDYFQDVMPILDPSGTTPGRALIPFPPLPAVILLPFVALFGLTTNAQLIATFIGAIDVAIAFWMLGRLRLDRSVRNAATIFLGLGTVLWYAAELGSTWFLAHVVAVGLTLAAIGLALEADPRAALGDDELVLPGPSPEPTPIGRMGRFGRFGGPGSIGLDRRQFIAGILFGLACTSRLTVILGAPFFVLVGGGGSWLRRAVSAGLGTAIPVGIFLAYNQITTGHLMHPGYAYLYGLETASYPQLNYHPGWSIEDPRYLVQNLPLMLAGLPDILRPCSDPSAVRGLFSVDCPLIVPRDVGMGLFLTSPAWLVAFGSLRWWGVDRLVSGAAIAVTAIAVVNLMHFSQGWVQFGYRFSNDFAPFALVLFAIALQALRRRWIGYSLIGLSIVINLWGVTWGHLLGW